MRVRWTTPAAEDLIRIVQRIKQDNPSSAVRIGRIIYDGCDNLRKFPRSGRRGRTEGTRELVFPGLPYIVVYQIKDDVVEIIRIYHGSQDWP